jgi:hypothetical protein
MRNFVFNVQDFLSNQNYFVNIYEIMIRKNENNNIL